jgi:small subunit ribosomal protein S11|tara:strand:+ start:441 stop:827 length:387 start_codon:yes stop_codon:yes gene_type:complete
MVKEGEDIAILNIYASFNNTITTITDLAGNTIGRISGGQITKHDRMRANPTIAMFIAKRVQDICKDYRINTIYVRMKGKTGARGVGPGAHAIVRTLTKEGFKILSIAETTAVPRGGPKKKGGRRGRRV